VALVELLLARGADPIGGVAHGSAPTGAPTRRLCGRAPRALR
jgi:hypothetical protein